MLAAVKEVAHNVEPVNEKIKTYRIQTEEAVHLDESGMRQDGLKWLHSASTALVTFFALQAKRGLCNAHLLRELTYLVENYQQAGGGHAQAVDGNP